MPSSCLATFLVACLCFTTISSTSNPLEVDRVNSELLLPDYLPVLEATLIAASTGRHLFQMPKSISEDCVRTAKVVHQLAAKPSLFDKIKLLVPNAIKTVQQSQQPGKSSEYAIELLCKSLNDQFAKNVADFPNVEQLKKDVELPKPTKDYYINLEPSTSASQMMTDHLNELEDPAFVQAITAYALLNADTKDSRLGVQQVAVAKAIRELAQREAFRSTVDGLFQQMLDAYVKTLYADSTPMMKKFDNNCYPYLKKIDEYFLQNSVLKEDYAKIKIEIMETMSQAKKIVTPPPEVNLTTTSLSS